MDNHKAKPIFSYSLIVFLVLFTIFISVHKRFAKIDAQNNLDWHAKVVAASLWNLDKYSHIAYIKLACDKYRYKDFSIVDASGEEFLDFSYDHENIVDKFFSSIYLMPKVSLHSQIHYKKRVIGVLKVSWHDRAILLYIYIILTSALILLVIYLYDKNLQAKVMLEIKVEERTKDLQNINAKLYESREKYRSLIEVISDWIWEMDENCVYTYTSPKVKDLLGYMPEDILGKTPFDLMETNDSDRIREIFQQKVKKKEPIVSIENVNRNKRGKSVVLETSAIPFFNDKNDFLGYRGMSKDITERNYSRAMMIQTEKMVTVAGLAGGMAHEINNPLAGVLQNMQVLINRLNMKMKKNQEVAAKFNLKCEEMEQYIKARGINEILGSIMEAGNRATKIVQNMLSFIRKSKEQKEVFNLLEIIDRTISLINNDYDLNKKYDFKDVKIERNYQGHINIMCEVSQIQQVFFNIFKNGAEAMLGPTMKGKEECIPTFVIDVEQENKFVSVTIEDNGPGMPEDICKRVFEPFFSTKIGEGTGLGLSVSYFIITKQHSGSIDVSSKLGYGTKFLIKLPLVQ